jgi:uncharacterized protein YecE (DUF72 family)
MPTPRANHPGLPARVYVGTSGWSYKAWDKTFYPREVPKNRQLEYYTTQFSPLRPMIAVVLWQLPGMLHKDAGRLRSFLRRLPTNYRHAVEFRHPSWLDEETFELLREHRAAHVSVSSQAALKKSGRCLRR